MGPAPRRWHAVPARIGTTFRRFVKRLENLGYVVEYRELVAADYGAPTSRKRLFLIARCDGLPIVWPAPTHGPGRAQPVAHRGRVHRLDSLAVPVDLRAQESRSPRTPSAASRAASRST
jgi:site-specific DNA-cytosine methylase